MPQIIAENSFIVLNDKGLHTRPSTELVKCATRFKAEITLSYQGHEASAKSLLSVLMLAATRGAKIKIHAVGEDAEEAIGALLDLAASKFHVQY